MTFLEIGSSGWALIQYDQDPEQKGEDLNTGMKTEVKDRGLQGKDAKEQEKTTGSQAHSLHKEPALPTLCTWTCSL